LTLAAVLVVAYLLGSIPTSYIVVYRQTGRDIRTMGTGNPGTMNVLDTLGWRTALLVAVGDISKGAAAVGLAYAVGLSDREAVLAALCAVIGHDWSIFLRFDGGNGTAAVIGGMLALMPLPTVLAATVSIGIGYFVSSRRIAGLAGIVLVPAFGFAFGQADIKLLGVVLLMAFTVLKIIRFEGFSPERPGR
jgi:glycerol-3-phosphate acyltransferase PlsY